MIIDEIYLWSYRIGILVLLLLALKTTQQKRNKAWLIISFGLSMLVVSTYAELFAWWYAKSMKSANSYFILSHAYKIFAALSTLVSVFGCWLAYKETASNPYQAPGRQGRNSP